VPSAIAIALALALALASVPVAAGAQASDPPKPVGDSSRALAGVVVKADAISPELVRVGFAERRRHSGLPPAHFVTRADIELRNPTMLREMLDRLGARARGCATGGVYIDGVLTTAGTNETDGAPRRTRGGATTNAQTHSEQLDRISPKDVEGMEIYAGSSQIPLLFRASGRAGSPPNCVIVIWTRSS
jgi:hypothetical protein